jgi:hypothetical protein
MVAEFWYLALFGLGMLSGQAVVSGFNSALSS